MSTPNIILQKPKVLVQGTASPSSINAIGVANIMFGTIINIYATSDAYSVGDVVMFVQDKAIQITSGAETFLLIDETNIFFKEQAAP